MPVPGRSAAAPGLRSMQLTPQLLCSRRTQAMSNVTDRLALCKRSQDAGTPGQLVIIHGQVCFPGAHGCVCRWRRHSRDLTTEDLAL